MKALAVIPGTSTVRLLDRPEPSVATPDDIKIRVLQVGICGTDREESSGGRARAPEGEGELIIGHEMFGRVTEVGAGVTRVRPGDYAVFTVRRECGHCPACAMLRPDMCETGDCRERGIWGLDGFQAEYVVDREPYVVRVPPELASVGVLTEPLSVAEKAIDEAVRLRLSRLPDASATPRWLYGGRWLVAGLGSVGLLAAMILGLRGAEVFGLDIVDPESARPQWLSGIGGRYVDGRQVRAERVANVIGPVATVVEAAGVPSLAFSLLDALAPNGVLVLTGIPGGDRSVQVPGAHLVRAMVLKNQVLIGSVNAAPQHYQMAVDDLLLARWRWGAHLERLITHRYPPADVRRALQEPGEDEIKAVVEWA